MAIKKGMTTMRQDGLIKILNGVTTIEEVKRVVG
jgi:type II secretory ATPase GspE/PulE/Tfp pilus assembly ATPase PilB-like protein